MSLPIVICIMLIAGIIGGLVNYLLPANNGPQPNQKMNSRLSCIVLGIGATLLVPLFLQIAQSKLLDHVYVEFPRAKGQPLAEASKETILITVMEDSAKKVIKRDSALLPIDHRAGSAGRPRADASDDGGARDYLLYAAYCMLGASAGFRFINMLINSVVKDKDLTTLKTENASLVLEKQLTTQQNQLQAAKDEQKAIVHFATPSVRSTGVIQPLLLPPILHADDPQKERFGGQQVCNFRQLKATVKPSSFPSFYEVIFWVEATDTGHPLNSDVLFYIHPSFHPSVFTVSVAEFNEGRAEHQVTSYGAFTIGAITDDRKTLLELDLAGDKSFPELFRSR